MNTWKRAPRTKQDKQNIRECKKTAQRIKQLTNEQINKWVIPCGETQRQIAYIAINRKYRDAVRRTWASQNRRGRMAQQHAVIRMEIALSFIHRCRNQEIPETGTHIQYDMQEIRGSHQR